MAREEALHFNLLRAHLQTLGHDYGDFQAHDGLWSMCEKTQDDILARMALVPRTLEARGLDATPLIQNKFMFVLATRKQSPFWTSSCETRWVMWPLATAGFTTCASNAGLDARTLYPDLVKRYEAPRLKPLQ